MKSAFKFVAPVRAITLAAILGLAGAATASADTIYRKEPIEVRPNSVSVWFGDLNTASEAGAATLLKRIERAGEMVCGKADLHRGVREITLQRTCYRDAVNGAVSQLGFDLVTAAHLDSHGWAQITQPGLQLAETEDADVLTLRR